MKLVCFQHSDYRGNENPVLACKTCCTIFVSKIKARAGTEDEQPVAEEKPATKYRARPSAVPFYQKGLR